MTTRNDVERVRNTKGLALLVEKLGYSRPYGQLQFDNGACASSILDFLDDNPGAIEVICGFILDNDGTFELEDEEE